MRSIFTQSADSNSKDFYERCTYKSKKEASLRAKEMGDSDRQKNGNWAASYFVAKLERV